MYTLSAASKISIHAPREGGDIGDDGSNTIAHVISIHAPREGGDFTDEQLNFYLKISIHAPREGGDIRHGRVGNILWNFNPRPPRGGRQQRCTVLSVNL